MSRIDKKFKDLGYDISINRTGCFKCKKLYRDNHNQEAYKVLEINVLDHNEEFIKCYSQKKNQDPTPIAIDSVEMKLLYKKLKEIKKCININRSI